MRNFIISMTALMLLSLTFLHAQEKEDSTDNDWYKWNDWGRNEWFRWERHNNPFIELNYGTGAPESKVVVSKFSDIGLAEIKLGYASKRNENADLVFHFSDKYAFLSRLASNLRSEAPPSGQVTTDLLRFGFGNRSGYGYAAGAFRVLPYYASSIVWSRLDVKNSPMMIMPQNNTMISFLNAANDGDILDRFNNNFRFGTSSEGGIRLEFASMISLNAGFETAVIFPRYMFWKHAGNVIIEEAAMGLVNKFIEEVYYSTPTAAPIVNFVLKNGLSYAFYTLKKDKMNWPFETEAPLTYQTFKFGVTFTF